MGEFRLLFFKKKVLCLLTSDGFLPLTGMQKTQKQLLGTWGEKQAVGYLRANGYKVLEQNYRYRRSEIDLIADLNGMLVFIEVKTRTGAQYGYPEEFVANEQLEMIYKAARFYAGSKGYAGILRFDIIAIVKDVSIDLQHFEGVYATRFG